MSRPRRIEFAGALYHIRSRGNGGADIVLDDVDRQRFLDVLGQVVVYFGWKCHSYCLMSNHYHLLIETRSGNLSAGMRQLNGAFSQWFNRRHRRRGHLFQGRFEATLVERESYLLELHRYVARNPVKPGLVKTAAEWRWSHFGALMGAGPLPSWADSRAVFTLFAADERHGRELFRNFVEGTQSDFDPRVSIKGQLFLGGFEFCAQFEAERGSTEVPASQFSPARRPLSVILGDGAPWTEAARIAHQREGYTMQQIADHLGIHLSTVSRRIGRRAREG